MSEAIKKIYETVTHALDINQSILSGCIDIVVAEQPNGTLKSTPFHLRFGKFQALRGRDAVIEIYVNGQKTDLQMKLGRAGEGYFDLANYHRQSSEVAPYLTDDAFSEADNATMSEDDSQYYQQNPNLDKDSQELQQFLEGNKKTWRWIWGDLPQKNIKEKEKSVSTAEPQAQGHSQTQESSRLRTMFGMFKGKKENPKENEPKQKQIEIEPESHQQQQQQSAASPLNVEKAAPITPLKDTNTAKSPNSQSEKGNSPQQEQSDERTRQLDQQLEEESQNENKQKNTNEQQEQQQTQEVKMDELREPKEEKVQNEEVKILEILDEQLQISQQDVEIKADKEQEEQNKDEVVIKVENIIQPQEQQDIKITKEEAIEEQQATKQQTLIQIPIPPNNQQANSTKDLDQVKVEEIKEVQTPVTTEKQQQVQAQSDYLEISLCSHLLKENLTEEQKNRIFDLNKITYEAFLKDPAKIATETKLVFRFGGVIYQKEVGFAILIAKSIYGTDLRQEQFVQDKKSGKQSLWNRWFGRQTQESKKDGKQKPQVQEQQQPEQKSQEKPKPQRIKNEKMKNNNRKLSEDVMISDTSSIKSTSTRRLKRSLKPTSEMLKSMNLHYGMNEIVYKVHTELQGTREMTGNIFLYKSDTKVVISDVDGTITKSDIYGQLMPMIGAEWNHAGVAQLFQSISKQGYVIFYLTARGIGQSEQTKGFIHTMQQDQVQLPMGPVIMSPDRLLPSFKREVIDKKPEVFKIQALKDIGNIFDQENPLFAGFGNRETDALAYQTVGIDKDKIFIIDTESQIHMVDKDEVTSYEDINRQIEKIFPSLAPQPQLILVQDQIPLTQSLEVQQQSDQQ